MLIQKEAVMFFICQLQHVIYMTMGQRFRTLTIILETILVELTNLLIFVHICTHTLTGIVEIPILSHIKNDMEKH